MTTWFVLAALAVAVYAAVNAAAIVWNCYLALPARGPFPAVASLLVVAPHQDDETIMAGGLMMRLAAGGADIRVVMVTDGVRPAPGRSDEERKARRQQRDEETLAALRAIGVGESQVRFLGIPAEAGLRRPETVSQLIATLSKIMTNMRPKAVITTAFEGGHPDHDATNYAVVRAAQEAGIPAERVFEACEYNSYFLTAGLLTRLNRLLLVQFAVPPRFIPGRGKPVCLDMSRSELAQKRDVLRIYKSQKPDILVRMFGFPDQFRIVEAHDYARGPYSPEQTVRYRICQLLGGSAERCNPFNYGVTSQHYTDLFGALERAPRAA